MQAVSVKGFKGYGKAAVALDQINSISESLLTPELQTFIETNLPAVCPDNLVCGGLCFLVPCKEVRLVRFKAESVYATPSRRGSLELQHKASRRGDPRGLHSTYSFHRH